MLTVKGIESLAFGLEKQVVGVTENFQIGGRHAAIWVEGNEPRKIAVTETSVGWSRRTLSINLFANVSWVKCHRRHVFGIVGNRAERGGWRNDFAWRDEDELGRFVDEASDPLRTGNAEDPFYWVWVSRVDLSLVARSLAFPRPQ